ncbi:hypothetical protein [Streptomyces sp. NPDC005301]|uniref:hypothetical protein n=1 Tax=unclassified Streptomyces TaxID=2593676 RepID=UPI0033A65EF6
MDRYTRPGHLEWWANPSTCLACIPVSVTALAGTDVWEAVVSPSLDNDGLEDLKLLMDADPYFTLRFETSAMEVRAETLAALDHLRLFADLDPEPPNSPT